MTTYTVRVFGHRGYSQIPIVLPKQFTSDGALRLTQPYEWTDAMVITDGSATPDSTPAQAAGDQTTVLRIEVPPTKGIRYEVNPPNRPGGVVPAGPGSPALQAPDDEYGIIEVEFRQGWSLSVVDLPGAV